MRNFMLLAQGIDVTPLLLAIKRRSELWKEDTYLRDFPQGPFQQIETIMLRFPEKRGIDALAESQDANSTYDQQESIDYPPYAVLHEARPMVMALMTRVGGERLGRVMINKIAPGGVIYPHVDTKLFTDYYKRFHIVLESQPGVVFRSGDEHTYMATGEVWWFDNSQEHEVINNSGGDRIHMVIDIKVSK